MAVEYDRSGRPKAVPARCKCKQSLYFPEDMLNEIQGEADRQGRSLSWIVQQTWRIARGEILRFPSVPSGEVRK